MGVTLVKDHVLDRGVGAEDEICKDARVEGPKPPLCHNVSPRLEQPPFRHPSDNPRVGNLGQREDSQPLQGRGRAHARR